MDGTLTIWIALAAMTGAAILAVLVPLSRPPRAAGAEGDVAVYKDQLAEIVRDAEAGLIGRPEAEAARIEVSRRLIAAADRSGAAAGAGATLRRRVAAVAAMVLIPAVALVAYGLRGQPGYPAQPLAERQRSDPAQSDIGALVARIEGHLAANPEDGRGWEVVAPVYVRLGRAADAVRARANALRILGATADREADLAETQTLAAGGIVTAEAKAGFERALALAADHAKAGYFMAIAAEQDGRPAEARAILARLLEKAPPGAPWVGLLRTEIVRLGGTVPPPATAAAPPVDIRAMVDGLAARLEADGSDFDGWLRLVRSYAVLGEADKARETAGRARARFAAEADKIGRLDGLIKELGIGGS